MPRSILLGHLCSTSSESVSNFFFCVQFTQNPQVSLATEDFEVLAATFCRVRQIGQQSGLLLLVLASGGSGSSSNLTMT